MNTGYHHPVVLWQLVTFPFPGRPTGVIDTDEKVREVIDSRSDSPSDIREHVIRLADLCGVPVPDAYRWSPTPEPVEAEELNMVLGK